MKMMFGGNAMVDLWSESLWYPNLGEVLVFECVLLSVCDSSVWLYLYSIYLLSCI